MQKKTIKEIIQLQEYNLHSFLIDYLKSKGYNVKATRDYIYGTIDRYDAASVGLVAHLDTVFEMPPKDEELFYDSEKKAYTSLNGLGADDRAGVYAIYSILFDEYYPRVVIFTHDEEFGGSGSEAIINDIKKLPEDCKYLIQLDRKGKDDCVFYNCGNKEFERYVTDYGWKTQRGSFSDISVLAPFWRIAAVNLSVGYRNEHTSGELLYMNELYHTIDVVKAMLNDSSYLKNKFVYIPLIDYSKNNYVKRYNPASLFHQEDRKFLDNKTCYYCAYPFKEDGKEEKYFIRGLKNDFFICDRCKLKFHPKDINSFY